MTVICYGYLQSPQSLADTNITTEYSLTHVLNVLRASNAISHYFWT